MSDLKEDLAELIGEQVVLDTKSAYLYIGTLTEVREEALVLRDVDVHDATVSRTTKELYTIQARKVGTRSSRSCVFVLRGQVVGLSALSDVVQY